MTRRKIFLHGMRWVDDIQSKNDNTKVWTKLLKRKIKKKILQKIEKLN